MWPKSTFQFTKCNASLLNAERNLIIEGTVFWYSTSKVWESINNLQHGIFHKYCWLFVWYARWRSEHQFCLPKVNPSFKRFTSGREAIHYDVQIFLRVSASLAASKSWIPSIQSWGTGMPSQTRVIESKMWEAKHSLQKCSNSTGMQSCPGASAMLIYFLKSGGQDAR